MWFGVRVAIVQVPSPNLNVVDVLTKLSPRSMPSTLNVEAVGPPKPVHVRHTTSRHIARVHEVRFRFVRASKLRIQINSLVFDNILVHLTSVRISHATRCLRRSVMELAETLELRKLLVTLPLTKPRWISEGDRKFVSCSRMKT